jgi:hypothetical protein
MCIIGPTISSEDEDDDPIMAEVRRAKAEVFAEYGNDIHRVFEDMKRRQFLFGNDVVARCKKTGEFVVIHKGTGKIDMDVAKSGPDPQDDSTRNPQVRALYAGKDGDRQGARW